MRKKNIRRLEACRNLVKIEIVNKNLAITLMAEKADKGSQLAAGFRESHKRAPSLLAHTAAHLQGFCKTPTLGSYSISETHATFLLSCVAAASHSKQGSGTTQLILVLQAEGFCAERPCRTQRLHHDLPFAPWKA